MNNRIWVLISFLVGLVLFSGNCFATTCNEENGVIYCNDVTSYTDTNGNVFTGIGTITISGGSESITILDRNLGATTNDISKTGSYGYYFQWGNNYGFPSVGDIKTSKTNADTSNNSRFNPYNSDIYILNSKFWEKNPQESLWGEPKDGEYKKQGPCPVGYHIPTSGERNLIYKFIEPNLKGLGNLEKSNKFANILKLPLAGYRGRENGSIGSQKKYGNYWSSSISSDTTYSLVFGNGTITQSSATNGKRPSGFSVRCFKDIEKNEFALNFNTMGGTAIQSQTVPSNGSGHVLGYEPTKTGSIFEGWYSDSDFKTLAFDGYFTTFTLTGDTTIYAKWIDENEEENESENETEKKQDEKSIEGKDIEVSLDSGLILYYTFDGDSVSGNNVYDQSNSHNTGTANSGVKFNSGNNYGSVEFNGTGVITLNDYGKQVKETNMGAISLRLNPKTTGNQIIIGSSYGPALGFYNKNYLIGYSDVNKNGKNLGIMSGLNLSMWNHIVVIWSGNNIKYYINNQQINNKTNMDNLWDRSGTISAIGSRGINNNPNYFSGYLDEIRVYNRTISEDEVVELYKTGFNPGEIDCNVEYSRNEENSGYIDATLICPDGVTIKGKSNHTFKESGEYIFEYDYGWNTGTTIATVKSYNIEFKAGANGTLSGVTEYSGLVFNDESNFKSLGIIEPQTIACSGFKFDKWNKDNQQQESQKIKKLLNKVSGITTNNSLENTVVSSDMTFIAQFKEAESTIGSGENENVNSGENQIINTGSRRKKKSNKTTENNETEQKNSNIVYNESFSEELNDAYKFAYENNITTMDSIEKANMLGGMDRISMAKMLSQYAINILGKEPADIEVPNFTDISEDLDAQYLSGVTLAYQLGIMGINMPNNEFRPFDLVPRAEFGTALSRMLYKLADGNDIYYSTHLNKLKSEGILKDINPSLLELRGWGMLMLMRSSSK